MKIIIFALLTVLSIEEILFASQPYIIGIEDSITYVPSI